MKFRLELMVVFMFMAVFCFGIVTSRNWPEVSRWYAWVICIPGFVLMGISFTQQLLGMRKSSLETPSKAEVNVRRYIAFFGWIIAFMITTWLFGFKVSSLLFVFSYLKMNRGGWLLSVSLTALVALLVYGLLSRVLEVPLIEGVVPQWLGF